MKKKTLFLFTPWFMGVLFVIFAMAMAFATFYENDFGAEAAKAMVYNTRWFELIFLLMIVNLGGQIFTYKLYKKKKITVMLFHLAFVLIIIGAGITRYFGFEGVVHIREGETQNICTSVDRFITYSIEDAEGNKLYTDSKKMMINSAKRNRYNTSTAINGTDYSVSFKQFLPNAAETIIDIPNGEPMITVLVSMGRMFSENITIKQGELINVRNLKIGFDTDKPADVLITLRDGEFQMQSEYQISEMSMMTQSATSYESNTPVELEQRKLYSVSGFSIVPERLSVSGIAKAVSYDYNQQQTDKSALVFELNYGNKSRELYVWNGAGTNGEAEFIHDNHKITIAYKALDVELPFSLYLKDFILDRYPGSSSPSSYKSDVVLIDKENDVTMPYSIYMNHILKYKGWRFYQSSYDRDEKGTVLSVNKDFAGMMVTYIGYFMLFLFMLLSMINKHSAFRKATANFFRSNAAKATVIIAFFMMSSGIVSAQKQKLVVNKSRADRFGKILVQDQRGRTEPLYTLSSDILRKVARDSELDGYTPMQVFLGLYFDFANWREVPMIKVSNSEVKRILGIRGNYAAFTDVVDPQTNFYKLRQSVNVAYNKPAKARTKYDKEIIKVDERLNICYMIYTGEFMKIFPVNDESHKWYPPAEAYKFATKSEDSLYLKNIVGLFADDIQKAKLSGDYKQVDEIIESIKVYQRNFAQYELPSFRKVNAEVFYYKSKIYDRLFPFYATVGLLLLVILIYGIIANKKDQSKIIKVFTGLMVVGFVFHTLGLAIRWYVSGHAPMSNGYESMIFISWVTILAGFIFSKRSAFVLAATSVLGGFTLMVAHLSFMDPEITNLVPVLQSYWLTLHVSIITGSYGFLGLGAIIGLIVLVLYAVINNKNKKNITSTIEELTVINYKALTIGLYLLTIGTFLGAIWANESWGRYWGWDPKETWSLITVIIYSFVIHSRMIQGLKGFFVFNVLALFGFSSVLMTYFGVNYYLSGLHSYAGGDPVPVPTFVPITVVALVLLAIFANWKRKKTKLGKH